MTGIQTDSRHLPDWFTKIRTGVLEECKRFPIEESSPLVQYENDTIVNKVKAQRDREAEIADLIKYPPKLTGLKVAKICINPLCNMELPESGKGSRKCLNCNSVYKVPALVPSTVIDKKVKDDKSKQRRVECFSPFMKEGSIPVDHNHKIIPIR